MTDERKTYFHLLSDAVDLTFAPIEAFYDLLDENEHGGGVENLLMVLRQLLDKQRDELKKIYEPINRTLGRLSLEAPIHDEVVEFEGRKFRCGDYFRAVVEPVKPQAAAEGGAA